MGLQIDYLFLRSSGLYLITKNAWFDGKSNLASDTRPRKELATSRKASRPPSLPPLSKKAFLWLDKSSGSATTRHDRQIEKKRHWHSLTLEQTHLAKRGRWFFFNFPFFTGLVLKFELMSHCNEKPHLTFNFLKTLQSHENKWRDLTHLRGSLAFLSGFQWFILRRYHKISRLPAKIYPTPNPYGGEISFTEQFLKRNNWRPPHKTVSLLKPNIDGQKTHLCTRRLLSTISPFFPNLPHRKTAFLGQPWGPFSLEKLLGTNKIWL